VFNFTPVPRADYRIGVPEGGWYTEILAPWFAAQVSPTWTQTRLDLSLLLQRDSELREIASIVGHEALTRPLGEMSFDSVEDLFSFAESTDLLLEFERLCRSTAIHSSSNLPKGLLFLNASAHAVEDPEWSNGEVEASLEKSGFTAREVVVEITERLAIAEHDTFQATLKAFKEKGYRVAVDDMGAGYASLQSLASIEPEFLKFDVSLVRDIDRSSIKQSLLDSLRSLAEKIHAQVIAEGVEREEERATLLALGIQLGQGFLFKREAP